MQTIENIKIEKLVFGGQGLSHLEDGKVAFVWNALPGEEVEFEITKNKKGIIEGIATKILKPSPFRIAPEEEHYLSCSPWQVILPEKENEWKIEMVKETYKKLGGFDLDLEIFSSDKIYGYRNKMEYSFAELPDGQISLAFFERGKNFRQANNGCKLADPKINEVANKILDWINEEKIPIRSLKSLIIRSNLKGETISALFIKDRLEFENYPEFIKNQKGFQLYYSTHKSPASVPTDLLYSVGQNYLIENINGVDLKYGLLSFFQVHIPIFTKVLQDIMKYVGSEKSVVDFYSGVGSIGLPLFQKCKNLYLIDNNEEAILYANDNIIALARDLTPALSYEERGVIEAKCVLAEKMTDLISSDKIIVLDPPRAGLHNKVVEKLLQAKPEKIIYLSCNISTQARDIAKLLPAYKIIFSKLYNFFPRTPHVEGLIVLERK